MQTDIGDINSTVTIITNTASTCFNIGRNKTVKQKKWLDKLCQTLQSELRSLVKTLSKSPSNPEIRAGIHAAKRQFKQCATRVKRQLKTDIMVKLESAADSDPTSYWSLLEGMKERDSNTDNSNPVPIEEWVDHIKGLFANRDSYDTTH